MDNFSWDRVANSMNEQMLSIVFIFFMSSLVIGISIGCFSFLYRVKWPRLRKWTCVHLGWHHPGCWEYYDGFSVHSKCPWCGKDVMRDGQGNWF